MLANLVLSVFRRTALLTSLWFFLFGTDVGIHIPPESTFRHRVYGHYVFPVYLQLAFPLIAGLIILLDNTLYIFNSSQQIFFFCSHPFKNYNVFGIIYCGYIFADSQAVPISKDRLQCRKRFQYPTGLLLRSFHNGFAFTDFRPDIQLP